MIDARLQSVYTAASRLFINQGYAKTQIDHIVRETGISIGALYDLFSGKKAILDFILRCTVDPGHIHSAFVLPIQEAEPAALEQAVIGTLNRVLEEFESPLNAAETAGYGYAQMLSAAFDLLSRYGTGCLLFEANPGVFPALFAHYSQYRLRFFQSITRYVEHFIRAGLFRSAGHPQYSAKFILETLYWWSMHIHYDNFDPKEAIPAATAKEICMDALLHAYQI